MKKIVFIFCIVISMNGIGQSIIPRSNGSITVQDYRVFPKYNQFIPQYQDTTAANIQKGIDSCGAIIFTFNTNSYWQRICSPKRWVQLLSTNNIANVLDTSGSVTNITNIYNNSITNYYFINGDSCVVFQNGDGSNNDTVCFGFALCNFYFLDDSTAVGCSCADTITQTPTCDTLDVGTHNLYIFQNFLWQRARGIVEFGEGNGLIHNTTANTNYYTMTFQGQPVYNYPYQFYNNQYFQGSTAIASFLSHGYGVSPLVPISTRLGINFTGDDYNGVAPNNVGYFNNQRVYWLGTNTVGYGSFGLKTDDNRSKNVGITFNTYDSTLTDGMSFYASPQGLATNNVLPRATLYNYRFLVGHTNGRVQLPQYVNIADAATDSAFYKRSSDGQIMYGKVNTGATTPAGNYGDIQINRNNVFSTPASDSLIYNSARLTVLGHQTITSANATGTSTSSGFVLNANSITSGNAMYVVSSSLTSGSMVKFESTSGSAASNTQRVLEVSLTGDLGGGAQTTNAGYFKNTQFNLGSSTPVGLTSTCTNGIGLAATGFSYAGYFEPNNAAGLAIYGYQPNAGSSQNVIFGSTEGSGAGIFGHSGTGYGGFFETFGGSGIGVGAQSRSNYGGYFERQVSTGGSINTVYPSILASAARIAGTVADGAGTSLDFQVVTTSNTAKESNRIKSIWTTATDASRSVRMDITGVINATTNDLMKLGDYVTLTESSATTFASTTIPSDKIAGGEIIVTVTANDASDIQARTLRFIWAAVNDAGTLTITIGTPEESVAVSAGTLTAAITGVDAGSGVLQFKANAVSSLTQTTLRCSYTFIQNF